ncbi:cellulose biosynthesis protein BcsQ [Acidicapsa ligni]|uniref:cellulose biosynthesis protein BcsQ n=1 Tax=Acidicapsa ligni TaxID=542300 RepID=UPI0021DF856B|nr:cellulose biosynthesis protein BcsQ [Acidicapsa ligni]
MTDQKPQAEPNETPEDVATLYSWANLHGAKYRDFTASRALAREEARLRVEEALAAEKRRQQEEAERLAQEEAQLATRLAAEAAEAARQAEADRLAEIARQAEVERQAVLAAQEAQRQSVQQRAWQPPPPEAYQGSFESIAPGTLQHPFAPSYLDREAPRTAVSNAAVPNPIVPNLTQFPQSPLAAYQSPNPPQSARLVQVQDQAQAQAQTQPPDTFAPPSYNSQYPDQAPPSNRQQAEQRESLSQPAWLAPASASPVLPNQLRSNQPPYSEHQTQGNQPSGRFTQPASQVPGLVDDTLLGSRERMTNRWFALKNIFDPSAAPAEPAPIHPPARVPVLAVFSLAGGVGKTSLVASLSRALSSRGERILVVDTAAFGLLPFFFGARDQRPGALRTFNPPTASADAPIQLITLDPDAPASESATPDKNQDTPQDQTRQDWMLSEVARYSRGANRILIDLPTASGSTTRRILRMSPVVLVPVVPDMSSVVSVGAIEAFFRHSAGSGRPILPYYLLNQFDYSLPLHLDVREILREQIGDRLLPFALRRSPAVSEALAEGMTVMDYAPNANIAEDYTNLAGWVRSLSAPAAENPRGVRWSER